MAVAEISVIRRWHCPRCRLETVEKDVPVKPGDVVSKFHPCPAQGLMLAPMIPAGTKAKITTHEREDYVGKDKVQLDDHGRPIMSITVEREDSMDTVVYAPTVMADFRDLRS